ncbi:hypothetical protein [Xanthomonas campestris]|uniref:hypothetical protein n=1 Tax=Xanthomonas campestris TaxID=339 RepID=UPI002B22A176|nr:hypothetical protein [Xanthomonas campestris]MEA9705218.1 hypothetical protein [Xanthomonas campestris pv. raphani]
MTQLTFRAPSYALLQANTQCWKCAKVIPVTTVWVPSFTDNEGVEEPDDEPEVGGTATLGYIEALDSGTAAHIQAVAPWLKPGRSETANATYWANHCEACGAIQGDHFVMGVNGPFFPQDQAGVDAIQVIPGHGPLSAQASGSQSGWMDLVAKRLG